MAMADDHQGDDRQPTLRLLELTLPTPAENLALDEAVAKLEVYLDSSEPNVRYNAAVGLAHHGQITDRAIAVFVEMLSPTGGLATESTESAKLLKRQIILSVVLPAIERLLESKTETNLTPLKAPLELLVEKSDSKEVQLKAQALLIGLKKSHKKSS